MVIRGARIVGAPAAARSSFLPCLLASGSLRRCRLTTNIIIYPPEQFLLGSKSWLIIAVAEMLDAERVGRVLRPSKSDRSKLHSICRHPGDVTLARTADIFAAPLPTPPSSLPPKYTQKIHFNSTRRRACARPPIESARGARGRVATRRRLFTSRDKLMRIACDATCRSVFEITSGNC